ncbi:hypothetical protein BSKO_08233 [Bryopsis sp. KO-2023]|nr:hypothetical protein BSKO_08233 [Bryopsis sp. KO-2023]
MVDITGVCCNGLVDEGGICCESQIIDECGICDGDGTACGVALALDMTFPVLVGLDDPSSAEFQEVAFNITTMISSNTNIPIDNLRVTKIETPSAKRRRLHQGRCRKGKEVQVEVVPPWTLALPEPEGRVTGEYVARELDKVTGYASNRMSFNGIGSKHPERVALCGNGVCETGERPTSEDWSAPENANACFPDCPYLWKECPGNPQCGGHGKCLPGDGYCECFTVLQRGYAGDGCDECSGRYIREGDLCVTEKIEWGGLHTTLSRNPYIAPPSPSAPSNDEGTVPQGPGGADEPPGKDETYGTLIKIIGGGVGVAVFLVAVVMVIRVHKKRQIRKTHNHNIEEELDMVGRMRSLDRVRFKRRLQRMQEKMKENGGKGKGQNTLETSLSDKAFEGRMDPFHRYLQQDPS